MRMKVVTDPALLLQRLMRLLRWRLWIQEKLQPTEWQVTLLWAAVAGFLGALSSMLFTVCAEGIHEILTGHSEGVVETMRLLPWWGRIAVPAIGGLLAGATLLLGKRLVRGQSSTDYMEAIAIGSGEIPVRSSLIKSTAALFSISVVPSGEMAGIAQFRTGLPTLASWSVVVFESRSKVVETVSPPMISVEPFADTEWQVLH